MRACGQKLVKFCTLTHIHTTAAKLVVRILILLSYPLHNIALPLPGIHLSPLSDGDQVLRGAADKWAMVCGSPQSQLTDMRIGNIAPPPLLTR